MRLGDKGEIVVDAYSRSSVESIYGGRRDRPRAALEQLLGEMVAQLLVEAAQDLGPAIGPERCAR